MKKFTEWFNPESFEHIKAYQHLQKIGAWPEGFIPADVEVDAMSVMHASFTILGRWLDMIASTTERMHQQQESRKITDAMIERDRKYESIDNRKRLSKEVAKELRAEGFKVEIKTRKSVKDPDGIRIYFHVSGDFSFSGGERISSVAVRHVRKHFKGAYVTSGSYRDVTIVDRGDMSEQTSESIYGRN